MKAIALPFCVHRATSHVGWFRPSPSAPMGAARVHHHWAAAAEVSCAPGGRHWNAPGWSLQSAVPHCEFARKAALFSFHPCSLHLKPQALWRQTHQCMCSAVLSGQIISCAPSGSSDHPVADGGTGHYRLRHAGGHWLCHRFEPSLCGQVPYLQKKTKNTISILL